MFEDFDLDEMAGANMNARDVHQHLKKRGWTLTRTSGGHDVYTHPKSEKHIAVPRHKQLKAPLVLGIMKTAKTVSEEKSEFWKKTSWIKKMSQAAKQERLAREKKEAEKKQVKEQYRDEGRFEPVKPHEVKSTAVVSPRKKSDSANVKLREEENLDEAVYSIKNTKTGQIYFHSKYPITKDNERLKKIQSAGGDHVHATPHKDGKPMNEAWNQPDYSQSIKARQAAADKKNKPSLKEGENKQVKGGDPCWKGYQMVGKKMKNGKEVPNCVPANEQVSNAPFDPPYSKKTGTHTDKSGAKHSPMSTAKHLAKMAAAKQVRELGKKTDPSRKGEIVKETMKDAKKKGEKKDQYNPDPTLTSQIIRTE